MLHGHLTLDVLFFYCDLWTIIGYDLIYIFDSDLVWRIQLMIING